MSDISSVAAEPATPAPSTDDAMLAAALAGGSEETETPVVTEPAAAAPVDSAAPETPAAPEVGTFGVHPSWNAVVEQIPAGAARDALIAQIRTSDLNAQQAIANANANTTPAEWRALIAQATEFGYAPDTFIEAFNGNLEMLQQMQEDPDAFLESFREGVEQLVSNGSITRKQGAELQKQAEEELAVPLTDEQKQIQELARWKQEQERKEQEREQNAEAARVEQEAAAFADSFLSDFDKQMIANGFVSIDASGKSNSAIPLSTLQNIAATAAGIIDEAPTTTATVAVQEAVRRFRAEMDALGAKLPQPGAAPAAARPGFPVIGGSNAQAPAPTPQPGVEMTNDVRENAMLQEILRLNAGS